MDSVKFVLSHLPDRAKIPYFMRHYGAESVPDEDAVRKWFSRGKIPAEQLLQIIICLERATGAPVSLIKHQQETS